MRNIVVQGGTDGMGRGLALACLRRGDTVLVLGRDGRKGAALVEAARELGAAGRVFFVAADLSLASENARVIDEARARFDVLDALVLCARHYHWQRRETAEGIESTFALFYVSRFLLCHGLAPLLEKAERPVVINVAGPGGSLDWMHWDDLGLAGDYDGQRALMQGGVANDLLGVACAERYGRAGIRHVLFNPGLVSTSFSGDYDATTAAQIESMKRMGRPVAQAIEPIVAALDAPPPEPLSAFSGGDRMSLDHPTFDSGAARRLHDLTHAMLRRSAS